MGVVEPVDFVYIFAGLSSETNRLDVQVSEAFVFGVTNQLLRFDSEVLWVKPHAEHLSIK